MFRFVTSMCNLSVLDPLSIDLHAEFELQCSIKSLVLRVLCQVKPRYYKIRKEMKC